MSKNLFLSTKPMLPFFQIISPRNAATNQNLFLTELNKETENAIVEDNNYIFQTDLQQDPRMTNQPELLRYHPLDIVPKCHAENTIEMITHFQNKPPTSSATSTAARRHKPPRRKHQHPHISGSGNGAGDSAGVHKMHRKVKNPEYGVKHKHVFGATFNGANNILNTENTYSNIDEHNACPPAVNESDEKLHDSDNIENKSTSTNNENIDEINFDSHINATIEQFHQIIGDCPPPSPPHEKKISRKQLRRTNEKLLHENSGLYNKVKEIEQLMFEKERQLTLMYQKLEEYKNEANIIKECKNCDEFRRINDECLAELERVRKENAILKSTIKKSCQNCTEIDGKYQQCKQELERQRQQSRNLNEDLNMLKNVVFRLNVQLERYQDKLRKNFKKNIENHEIDPNYIQSPANQDIDNDHTKHEHIPVSWGNVNTHTLAPLLDAYQDAISEKDDIIKQYEKELENCSGKLKDILTENEMLHKKILDDEARNVKADENQDLVQREIVLLQEKNDMLTKKCTNLNEKVQELLKIYEQKVESMNRDYEQLHKEYHSTRSELCTLQGKHQILLESISNQKKENEQFIPVSVHNATVADCRRAYDELKLEYDSERNKLNQQIRTFEQQRLEFEKEVVSLRAEKQELQMTSRSLDKMVKKLQIKCDQQQNQIVSLQLSRDSCRRQLQKAFTFSRELVQEQERLLGQLAEKNRESRSLQQLSAAGSEMTNKMESIKTQFKNLQQEAMQSLDSVEQKMHQQDAHIHSLKKSFDTEIAKLNQMLLEKDEIIQKLSDEMKEQAYSKPSYLLYGEKHKK